MVVGGRAGERIAVMNSSLATLCPFLPPLPLLLPLEPSPPPLEGGKEGEEEEEALMGGEMRPE